MAGVGTTMHLVFSVAAIVSGDGLRKQDEGGQDAGFPKMARGHGAKAMGWGSQGRWLIEGAKQRTRLPLAKLLK